MRLVLSLSVYPSRGWRDNSKNPSVIVDVMVHRAFPSGS
jgi:hypothetical protein